MIILQLTTGSPFSFAIWIFSAPDTSLYLFLDIFSTTGINWLENFDHLLVSFLDSSLIVATASKYFDKLNTFTVTFPDLQKYDESQHAQIIAKHFNTNHIELNAEEVEPEIFYKLVKHYDEPMVDSSMIPTYLLSKEIRKHCKVAIGGDGADELFGGYSHYNRYNFLAKIQRTVLDSLNSIRFLFDNNALGITWD